VSARAAWRLETLGFADVHRYQPGKDDWLAARLPMEGSAASVRRAVDVARSDVPVCGLRDRVAEAARRVREEGWPLAVVVNEHSVVLGRLRPGDLDAHSGAVAADLLVAGPRTVRGTRPLDEMAGWLDERHIPGVLVTTPDGVLVGYVRREDVAG
jgi:CBS domain-containing protein